MRKPQQIKIWPEIISYIPALIHIKTDVKKVDRIIVDFSNCWQLDASGLNILLGSLLTMKASVHYQDAIWEIPTSSMKLTIKNDLILLGFFSHFKERLPESPDLNLFGNEIEDVSYESLKPRIQEVGTGAVVYSYPLYKLDFGKYDDRREAFNEVLADFKGWLRNIFNSFKEYNITKNELLLILKEIIKNSADHTEDNAYFAIDIREEKLGPQKKKMEINFSFMDFGKGIYRTIWDFISEELKQKRIPKRSITEAYHKALQMGFSTKTGSKNNMGLGMSIITEGAKGIDLNLSVFDAQSRGVLTSIQGNSHAEIRRHFFDTGSSVNFFYYGRICFEGKNGN